MSYNELINFQKNDLSFNFLPTGDIFNIKNKNILINQLQGNFLDGSLMNIYLRIKEEKAITYCPLIGIHSDSTLLHNENSLVFTGTFKEVTYTVTFTLTNENYWFWKVDLTGDTTVDLIFGQDLGIASEGALLSNESYVCQYIDHKVIKDDKFGYIITSRQNQPEGNLYPLVQHGCLSYSEHFSTDGFQFYGLDYKENNTPYILDKVSLCDDNYQYEFAYAALQTKNIKLDLNKANEVVFYGYFTDNSTVDEERSIIAQKAYDLYSGSTVSDNTLLKISPIKHKKMSYLKTLPMSKEETSALHPQKILVEQKDNDELSYFTKDYEHVVYKSKELLVERGHGSIIQTGHENFLNEETIATTFFMYGIFNAQIVLGNTTFNKLISNTRNHLNIFKISGQRIWIDDGKELKLLLLPSLFEMGINYGKWFYKTEDDIIEITNYVTTNNPEIHLCVKSQNGRNYKFYITNRIIMGDNENSPKPDITVNNDHILFKPNKNTLFANTYPNTEYRLQVNNTDFKLVDDGIFFEDNRSRESSLMILSIENNKFDISITGNLHGTCNKIPARNFLEEKDIYNSLFNRLTNNFKLMDKDGNEDFNMNITLRWFLHNALIHYVSPHGLEQFGGAAWGTRDICQGPFELMVAFERYDEAKEILRKVYSHQFNNTGNWPQWFMFDKYETIQADESHGDIIVWPLKALGDYLEITNDFEFLDLEIPYCDFDSKCLTKDTDKLINHVKKQLKYIFENTMFDTALSNYGNGDWDDTLQPDNSSLKASMVSSWTVALTYQTIKKFSYLIKEIDGELSATLEDFYLKIEEDFKKYLIKDDVVAGLAIMKSKEDIQYLIHPSDTKTGITYRLLPMTRSIIAELFSGEEAISHTNIIQENLKFQDGVRLIDKPVKYLGGKTVYFKRGEQAANFGREIGILYVHSNIRYSEAMAKLGNGFEAWNSLYKISPVGLKEFVPNAMYRQSNLYFSSSDADFHTRYEASDSFSKLKDGKIGVKGGWRLYSSGPGIYIKQLITNCIGLRRIGDKLIIDPVFKDNYGFSLNFKLDDYDICYTYVKTDSKNPMRVYVNQNEIPVTPCKNKYRDAGVESTLNNIYKYLNINSLNFIEIHV